MERSFTTLLGRPAEPSKAKKIVFGILALPFILPFAIAAGISIPWTKVIRLRQRSTERKFAKRMKKAGRVMTWQEFQQAIGGGKGTVIGEYLSPKGPFRLWWTPEDVPATSPHKWKREQHFAWMEPEFVPFFEWCYARYTNPQSGLAELVLVPEEERNLLQTMLTSTHFVSICSFPSLRERHSMKVGPD